MSKTNEYREKRRETGKQEDKKSKRNKSNNRNQGITLVALVVTIIILLILAGISISALTGDNSLINQAGSAKEQSEIDSEKEIVETATVQAMRSK